MRPGALARRGLGYEALRLIRPELVFCAISGYGMTGPYKDAPAHGVAFDSWAGLVKPGVDAEGFCFVPEHPSIGMHAGPLFAALSICAALLRARATGTGAFLELGQSDAAAYMDWLRIETWKAYERPQSEVTGNKTDDYVRRAPGTAGMEHGVRYQYYASADGHILFMASEQEFWKNFCTGIDRPDLFERWPGSRYGDHATGNRELQLILRDIFATRTTHEWMAFAVQWNTAIAPLNTPRTIARDPHFKARFSWLPASEHVADMLPFPVHFVGEELPPPAPAPRAGQHNDSVLRELLGYSEDQLAAVRESGALG
jgi:crotonobetainyl-CoA:carnitine CoA-transferase CaiB-like acyl-CoA transferase